MAHQDQLHSHHVEYHVHQYLQDFLLLHPLHLLLLLHLLPKVNEINLIKLISFKLVLHTLLLLTVELDVISKLYENRIYLS